MELADSKSRIEWFNRCCELQNALGQADKQLKTYEAEIGLLTTENKASFKEIDMLGAELKTKDTEIAKLKTAIRKHLQTDDVFYLEKALEGKP